MKYNLSFSLSLVTCIHSAYLHSLSLSQDHATIWVWQLPGPTADSVGSKSLSFNVKQKLQTLAFASTLLRTRLGFFHGRMGGDETLDTWGQLLFLPEKILPHHNLPCVGSWNASLVIPWNSLISTYDMSGLFLLFFFLFQNIPFVLLSYYYHNKSPLI